MPFRKPTVPSYSAMQVGNEVPSAALLCWIMGLFFTESFKHTVLGFGHDQRSADLSAAFNTVNYKVWATCPWNQTGASVSPSQMVHLIPTRRPKAGSCSSSLGVLAMASQQIRLCSPWSYTLLILSEADSADAQLPQCLEEHQLSQTQPEEMHRTCVSIKRKCFLKLCRIQNPSPLFFSYMLPKQLPGIYTPLRVSASPGVRILFCSFQLQDTCLLFLRQQPVPFGPSIWFWAWVTARLSLSDQQKKMPRLCSWWKTQQHPSQSPAMGTVKKITAHNIIP